MITLKAISKYYAGTAALVEVDAEFHSDEVHALVGENGAGKTTLVSILAGSNTPSAGTIMLDGKPVTWTTPAAALRHGIAQVSQEGSLVGALTGAENILLGVEPAWGRVVIDRAAIRREAEVLLRRWFPHTRIDLGIPVERLAFADQKVVEILRALRAAARLLILDEPTATLPAREKRDLWALISGLPAQGVGIVLISHFLSEVLELSDRITVLRDGRKVADLRRGEADAQMLARHMLQRDPDASRLDASGTINAAQGREGGTTVLAVERWSAARFNVAEFGLRAGEIVGLIGLTGAGHFEFASSLFDQSGLHGGRLFLDGCEQRPGGARRNLSRGIAMVPDHRMMNALIGEWTVRENLSLAHVEASAIAGSGVLSLRRERDESRRVGRAMSVRSSSDEQLVAELSGGNKQKVSIGKWLFGRVDPYRVLVFVEPTEGVDVGAKSEIHALMRQLCERGVSIVVTSTDLLEVMTVADRVFPFVAGRPNGSISRRLFSEAAFIEAIAGGDDVVPPGRPSTEQGVAA